MIITKKSPISGNYNSRDLNITEDQINKWREENLLIQDAFPNLTASEREFIKTGITDEEWDSAFKS